MENIELTTATLVALVVALTQAYKYALKLLIEYFGTNQKLAKACAFLLALTPGFAVIFSILILCLANGFTLQAVFYGLVLGITGTGAYSTGKFYINGDYKKKLKLAN